MKKNLFFAALAITALVSCSESDYLGDERPSPVSNDVGAINFGTGLKAVTRAEITGQAAAALLNNNFVVEGVKTIKDSQDADSVAEVFDNYNVNWRENTADKTLSNTANWEYVGQSTHTNSAVHEQSIKYWDFAASQYDFWAYSVGGGDATVISLDSITHSVNTPVDAAYTISGDKEALSKVYISDLVTAYNPNENVSGKPVMGNEVELSFRSLVTKVRVGLYETVPGYSVREVKFYPASNGTPTTTATLYASSSVLPAFDNNSASYTVSFPTRGKSNVTNSDYNKAHVAISSNGTDSKVEFGTLAYGPHQTGKYEQTGYTSSPEAWTEIWLQRASSSCTWAKESSAQAGDYSIVLPNETGAVLTLKVDYILESIDGTGETITVHGATALVPSQYTQWKPNYAYTYLFKISDNTNGLTNIANADKVGLYPITLNAVVVDTEEFTQETITTVATPSITTYSISSDVTQNNEYVVGDSIYVTATTDGTLLNMDGKAVLYQIEKLNTSGSYVDYAATEAEVLDALTTYTSLSSDTYVGRDSIRLTPVSNALDLTVTEIPLADGNTITKKNATENLAAGDVAKIQKNKMGAGKYYAFVYTHDAGDAANPTHTYLPVYVAAGGDVTGLVTKNDGSDTAATTNANEAQTLYAKYFTVKNAVYGIKVIKIKAN